MGDYTTGDPWGLGAPPAGSVSVVIGVSDVGGQAEFASVKAHAYPPVAIATPVFSSVRAHAYIPSVGISFVTSDI